MFNMNRIQFAFCSLVLAAPATVSANESVARQWNELLLESIRNDFARPTVHARISFTPQRPCGMHGAALKMAQRLGSSMSRSRRPEILIFSRSGDLSRCVWPVVPPLRPISRCGHDVAGVRKQDDLIGA